jgi:hypothetical protein
MQEKMVAVVEPLIALEKRLMMAWRTTTTFYICVNCFISFLSFLHTSFDMVEQIAIPKEPCLTVWLGERQQPLYNCINCFISILSVLHTSFVMVEQIAIPKEPYQTVCYG